MSNISLTDTITIRAATPADRDRLSRLAQRDSATVPAGPLLVAESDGAIRAAIAVETGRLIADPFHPTAALAELLRTRAGSVRRPARLRLVASYRGETARASQAAA